MAIVSLIAQMPTCAALRGVWRRKVTLSKQSSMYVPKHSSELKAFEAKRLTNKGGNLAFITSICLHW